MNQAPDARFGLGHYTFLDHTPPDLVELAAAAGYSFVGLHAHSPSAQEVHYDLRPGSRLSKETRLRCADTGVTIAEMEYFTIGPTPDRELWMRLLEAGAELGARYLLFGCADADIARLSDALAQLSEDALPFSITPLLEPISFLPVSTVDQAARLARQAGIAIMVDALHVVRGASPLESLTTLEPELLPVVQLCDGPARTPGTFPVIERMPGNLPTEGIPLLQEARGFRRTVGEGDFPLADILAAINHRVDISLEIPDALATARMTPLELATANLRAATRAVGAAEERRAESSRAYTTYRGS